MTWAEIFERLGIEWCPDCSEHAEFHEHGGLEAVYLSDRLVGYIMHWRDRRMTRPGIYKMLRKVVRSRQSLSGRATWEQIYLLNHGVVELTKELGIRLPRSVFDLDRARLRYALGEYSAADVARMTPGQQSDFRAARRWAARS